MKGIDYTSPINLAKAKEIKAAGYDFICRYVVPDVYAWKRLTKAEAQAASDAGLNILSVFETSAGYMRGGAAQAKIDAPIVLQEMQTLGQPKGSAIYFTADFDVTTDRDIDAIERYLRQMTALLTNYQVGIYAEYQVIEVMADRKACKHFWQTYAWSGGKWSKHANVHQFQNGKTVCGMTVDLNESFGGEGFWSLRAAGPFPDVSAERWSAPAIKIVQSAGFMGGYPDGSFKPDQPVTREELAAALSKVAQAISNFTK